jgi:1,4-dihydroxy-2-naphthoate octaprenyltransferase
MKLSRGEQLLLLAAALALIHHVDHVLRVDHSGWPFLQQVTPFTFSLVIYPIFLSVFVAGSRHWLRVSGTAVLFLFSVFAHAFMETPRDQYRTWAYGSDFPGHIGQHNLLGQDSRFLGVVAVIVTVLLSLTLAASLIVFLKEAREKA